MGVLRGWLPSVYSWSLLQLVVTGKSFRAGGKKADVWIIEPSRLLPSLPSSLPISGQGSMEKEAVAGWQISAPKGESSGT